MTPKSITQEAREWLKQDGPVYAGYSPHDAHVQQFVLAFAASLEERFELVERKKCEYGCHLAEPHMRCVDCRPTPQEKPVACEHERYYSGSNQLCPDCKQMPPIGWFHRPIPKPQPLVSVEELDLVLKPVDPTNERGQEFAEVLNEVIGKLNEVVKRLNLLANK